MASPVPVVAESEIDRCLRLTSETESVDFKSAFNPTDKGEFLEILKDILAMANSGGGIIVFGLSNDGSPTGGDLNGIANLDPAKITDAIYKYTDCQFSKFSLQRQEKNGSEVWLLLIDGTSAPIVFSQTGNYLDPAGKQKNAFIGGTIYFRHGAKSEPGNSDDLRQFIERRLDSIRHEWLDGIAKVVEAPSGSEVHVLAPGDEATASGHVRFTSSQDAPSLPVGAIDQGWPYRQKEVVVAVNEKLAGTRAINANHILNVRRAFDIEANGDFCYTQKHVSPKYSNSFVNWIVEQFEMDANFFEKAKEITDHKRRLAQASAV